MSTFTLIIETDNAAFADDPRPELGRILRLLGEKIETVGVGHRFEPVFDVNGNEVGSVALRSDLQSLATGETRVYDQEQDRD